MAHKLIVPDFFYMTMCLEMCLDLSINVPLYLCSFLEFTKAYAQEPVNKVPLSLFCK